MLERLLTIFNKLDWFFGGACLLVGLYMMNPWLMAGGVFGLLSAYFQPANYLKKKLEAKMLSKHATPVDDSAILAEDAFYAAHLEISEPAAQRARAAATDGPRMLIWGVPHNRLEPELLRAFTKQDGADLERLKRPYY